MKEDKKFNLSKYLSKAFEIVLKLGSTSPNVLPAFFKAGKWDEELKRLKGGYLFISSLLSLA